MQHPSPAATLQQLGIRQSRGASAAPIYQQVERCLEGRSGDLLDFGSGVGILTQRLARNIQFGRIVGVDMLPRPPELPSKIEWICADLNSAVPLPAAAFDLIVAAEVIEHLENPRAVVREWARLLKPGGTLICSTPNNESIRSLVALLVRGHFVQFGDSSYPAHITALLQKDLERILQEGGLDRIEFFWTEHGGLPGLPQFTWQQISFSLLRGRRFSDNIIAVAMKP